MRGLKQLKLKKFATQVECHLPTPPKYGTLV